MINRESLRDYCLGKQGVTEKFPFDEETLVFMVMNKMFLLTNLEAEPISFNVKCEPELAVALREKYDAVTPAFHMNKKHWNSVEINGSIPAQELLAMIDHSYALVVAGLTKKLQEELALMHKHH